MDKRVIAVDLDGTLAAWSPDYAPDKIGKPVPAMMDRVKGWLNDGHEVYIHTARVGSAGSFPHIKKWLRDNGLPDLEVTNRKKSETDEYWDDRAVAVERNTGKVLGGGEPEMSWEDEARKALK